MRNVSGSFTHGTFLGTAAFLWAAGTANVAAASLRAALAAADAKEEDEEEGPDDDEQHCQPVCGRKRRQSVIHSLQLNEGEY